MDNELLLFDPYEEMRRLILSSHIEEEEDYADDEYKRRLYASNKKLALSTKPLVVSNQRKTFESRLLDAKGKKEKVSPWTSHQIQTGILRTASRTYGEGLKLRELRGRRSYNI